MGQALRCGVHGLNGGGEAVHGILVIVPFFLFLNDPDKERILVSVISTKMGRGGLSRSRRGHCFAENVACACILKELLLLVYLDM